MKLPGRRAFTLLLALAAAGCSTSPFSLDPTPELDVRAPFPELDAGGPEPEQGSSGLQRALSRAGWAGEENGTSSSGVPLAGRLVGEFPDTATGTWRWLVGEDVTFGIRSPEEGKAPDAFIYAEAFSSRKSLPASEELMHFELTVDPALLGEQLTWPTAATAWAEPVARNARERDLLRRLAWMATTRTGGKGFGYTSSPRTFTGWRWLGRNRQGVSFRLARSTGEWSGQKPLDPELEALLPRLVQRFPQASWLLAAAGPADPWSSRGTARTPTPAYMILGTAAAGDTGIYLAVLCARTPTCGPAGDLSGFLASLRLAETGEVERLVRGLETGSVESLAADLGITLRDSVEPGKPPS